MNIIQEINKSSTVSDYSNWVIPGKIMCGPYPYCDGINFDEKTGLDNIKAILKDGVNVFVSLCGELPDSTKRSDVSSINHPYFPKYRHYTNAVLDLNSTCDFIYIPINDGGIPGFRDIIKHINLMIKLINRNRVLYIHCAGGHGRTNIYTSILFSYFYNIEPEMAIFSVFLFRENRRKRDKKLAMYNIPRDDKKRIFNSNQEELTIAVAKYFHLKKFEY
jgi:hypothetical protein